MSIKLSFMHYMKWTRVMLSVFFEEFELVYIFIAIFSFHYYCRKWSTLGKIWGTAAPPVFTGLSFH